ncbi:MAG: hypothetical protein CMP63_01270 [Flavobacteriales bacterium]|nr:hypothetical protein [Flavobacteriales bacterium]|tara:strand:- start:5114 stop:5668 length:555 start_codon:yes stop_codon:yes gene_type:complete
MKKIGGQIEYTRPKKDELKVEISPFLSKNKMNMLVLWGAAWTFCGLVIIVSLFTYGFNKDELVMVSIFLIFWAYFELKIVHAVRWNKRGKEIIELKNGEFTYYKLISGRGLPIKSHITKMRPFRYAEDTEKGFWNEINKSSWMVGGEVIEYAIEEKIKRLGMKISKKDANQLITLLNKTSGFNA